MVETKVASTNESKDDFSVTMRSPINIALVKYWGKAHEKLIIPSNNSLSLTINKDQLCSETTVTLSDDVLGVELTLNGEVEKITDRINSMIKEVKEIAQR